MHKFPSRHSWQVTVEEAIEIQNRLRREVLVEDFPDPVNFVAGIDVGPGADKNQLRAAVVVLSYPGLELEAEAVAIRRAEFAYRTGLLSFREVPAALDALSQLAFLPDLLLCDGQGYAHPRRFGLACHLGVLTGIPSIGVAKSRLVGRHEPAPDRRGAWQPLYDAGQTLGAVLRTRVGVKPIYVSVGHRITLERAVEFVLACTPRYRLPETTRRAHRLASGINRSPAPVHSRQKNTGTIV